MATIRQRNGRWQAIVRYRDKQVAKSFHKRADAERWAYRTEVEVDRGGIPATMPFRDLLERYRDEICPRKRAAGPGEIAIINRFLGHPLANKAAGDIRHGDFVNYRHELGKRLMPSTIGRHLAIYHHVFAVGQVEWGINLPSNPVATVRRGLLIQNRGRRLEGDEEARLIGEAEKRVWYLAPVIKLALETAMREGELLSAEWRHLDRQRRLLFLPITKNGNSRHVPISPAALEILDGLPRLGERILPIRQNTLRMTWHRMIQRLGIVDLHFHDLRHEAISRAFERGLSVPEVMLVSGHRDMKMLGRYTHLRPEDVARKLG